MTRPVLTAGPGQLVLAPAHHRPDCVDVCWLCSLARPWSRHVQDRRNRPTRPVDQRPLLTDERADQGRAESSSPATRIEAAAQDPHRLDDLQLVRRTSGGTGRASSASLVCSGDDGVDLLPRRAGLLGESGDEVDGRRDDDGAEQVGQPHVPQCGGADSTILDVGVGDLERHADGEGDVGEV